MAVIYAEQSGVAFRLLNGNRVIYKETPANLTDTIYVIGSEHKKYPANANKIAQRTYKDRSYIVDGNSVYYYKATELENFNDGLSPYQILIINFLKDRHIQGSVLLLDGNKDAIIISLIVNGDFKYISISNSGTINDSMSDIRKIISKEAIELQNIIINDEFYAPLFQGSNLSSRNITLSPVDILEYAETFPAPVFHKIADIKAILKKAYNKKTTIVLLSAIVIFTISLSVFFYISSVNKRYSALNSRLQSDASMMKGELKLNIENKFLTLVRLNIPKSLKSILLKMSSVNHLKVISIESTGKNWVITGKILGGYRNFTSGYNKLKTVMSGDKTLYTVSPKGKARFIVSGVFK